MKQIIPLVAVVMSLSAVAGNEANPDAVELAPLPVPVEFTSNMDAPVAFDATATVTREQFAARHHALPFFWGTVIKHGIRIGAGFDDFFEVEGEFGRHVFGFKRTFVGVTHDRTEAVVG